jgi:type I restriction enzyme S subunit
VRKGILKSRRTQVPPEQAEPPWTAMPKGWSWARLEEVVACEDGAITDGPFGTNLMTQHYVTEAGHTVIRLGNIGVGRYIRGKDAFVPRPLFERLSRHHAMAGDLIVAGLADPVARACIVPEDLGPALVKADCFRARLHRSMDTRWVMNVLNSQTCRVQAEAANHGMTRTRINLGNLRALFVPVPPLAEQKRIVAKVDQLMKLCDDLEAKLHKAEGTAAKLVEAAVAEMVAA